MTFTFHRRLQTRAVRPLGSRLASTSVHLGDQKYSGRSGRLGQPEAPRFSVTRRETWQFCRSERDRVCIYFDHSTCGGVDIKLDARRDSSAFYLSGGRRRDRDGGGILDRSYKDQHQDGPGADVVRRPQLGRPRF